MPVCCKPPLGPRRDPRAIRPTAPACALLLALLPAAFAGAEWRASADAEICIGGSGTRGLDVAVCGRALAREGLSDMDRARLHTARGTALRDNGEPLAALADFDAALELNPLSAHAFNERALTLDTVGHYARALEDFRRALVLSPRFAAAYKNRALAHFYAGILDCARSDLASAASLAGHDAEIHAFTGFLNYLAGRYEQAADDFRRVKALALPYPYLPLWRYLAGTGGGEDRRGALLESLEALAPGEWPRPLVETYLGERDARTFIVSLEKDARSPRARRHLAASHYYLAALERLNGRREQTLRHLHTSLDYAEHRMPERVLAEHALAQETGNGAASISGTPHLIPQSVLDSSHQC